ncbi:glycosyltransferase [Halovulum dunhuangense]|uniref:Glycosyltransferase n=1 Tax=Halovulum dunhuangense TaxID=1505036 RepID=A0A849L4C0_9RHOB|nr:glycosyltransferase [Halovulum dunhuangense]
MLQLLPDQPALPATTRAIAVARALKAEGGEMVVAGGDPRTQHRLTRAGLDHRPYSGARTTLFQSSATQALLDTVHQRNLGLVHVHGFEGGLAARAFADAANLPLVMTCESLPRPSGFLGRRSARKHVSGRPVIVRSAYAADCLRRDFGLSGADVRVIAPGIDPAEFDALRVSPERVMAQAAAWGLSDDPRPVILVPEASADAHWLDWLGTAAADPALPDAVWVLIGQPEGEERAIARIAQGGARGRIRWVEACEDWAAAYKLAALVLSLPTEAPGLCDHALQAQAMGRPVITTDSGAGAEVVQPGKTGWLVRHRDAGSLVYAVSAALDRDEILQAAMAMAARNFIQTDFSVARMQTETLALYREVLSGRAGG